MPVTCNPLGYKYPLLRITGLEHSAAGAVRKASQQSRQQCSRLRILFSNVKFPAFGTDLSHLSSSEPRLLGPVYTYMVILKN